MRLTRALLLAIALLVPALASAQDYQWIDERGSVHFASDPSEVPIRFREKAVRDQLKREHQKSAMPAAPAAPSVEEKPAIPSRPKVAAQKRATELERQLDSEYRKAADAHRRELEADEKKDAKSGKRAEAEEKAESEGRTLVPEGFHRECDYDSYKARSGQAPPCRLVENEDRMADRMERAREQAKDDLGISDEEAQKDPEARKELDKRVNKNYQRTAPDPYKQPGSEDEPEEPQIDEDE